jgi:hypothetical protein
MTHASLFSIEQRSFASSSSRCRRLSKAAANSGSFSAAISAAVFPAVVGAVVIVEVGDKMGDGEVDVDVEVVGAREEMLLLDEMWIGSGLVLDDAL